MENQTNTTQSWRFGVFEVDARNNELRRGGAPAKVREQSFRILVFLLEHAGELVTREDLQRALWSSGTFVDFDHGLNTAVMKLREVLGDSADKPLYIETVPKRGYRFIAPVSRERKAFQPQVAQLRATAATNEEGLTRGLDEDKKGPRFIETVPTTVRPAEAEDLNGGQSSVMTVSPTVVNVIPAKSGLHSRRWLWPTLAALGVAALAVGYWYLRRPLPPLRLTNPVQLTRDGRRKNVVGTDGNRLYLNILEPKAVGQVPVSGGLITEIPFDLPSQGGLWGISSVSPDGSSLLAFDHFDLFRAGARVSIVGILGDRVRYLTESYAAIFSPDGRSVLYATPHGDLYSMAAEGGEPRLIFASHAPEGEIVRTGDLSWSPGGNTIRFTRDQKMWEVSSGGSNPHLLLPGWHATAPQCCGQWTLDGEFFLFVSGSIGSMNVFPNYHRGGQLWAIDERRGRLRPPIGEPIQLTSGPMVWGPVVSARDGHRIFSRGMSLRGELVRYDKRSNHFDPYLRGISAEMVAFSRDERDVAYVTFPDGILWRANRDGTGLQQLTKPPFYPRDVRWSPDGSEIVFTDNSQNGVDAIYVVPSHGGTPERLIPEESGPHADLTWSPDGKKVVYSTLPWLSIGNYSLAKIEVRILDLATRKTITLPHRPEGFWSPRWSPDGRYIAGLTFKRDNLSIFDLKTQGWRDLLQKGLNGFPSWSKDGRFVYFLRVTDNRGIFRIPLSGGDEERIVDLKDSRIMGWYSGGWLGLDPTDTPLLLRDAGTDEIYAFTLERK